MTSQGRFLAIFGCWYLIWVQPLDGSISLKFSLETRQESVSFETLIDFLAFLVQKLWPKINKINNPITGLITNFVYFRS